MAWYSLQAPGVIAQNNVYICVAMMACMCMRVLKVRAQAFLLLLHVGTLLKKSGRQAVHQTFSNCN